MSATARVGSEDSRTGGESDDWQVTFFRLGDRYLVTVLSDLEKGVEPDLLAWGQTMVVSSEFEVLATLMS